MKSSTQSSHSDCEMNFHKSGEDRILIQFTGNCTIETSLPSVNDLQKELEANPGIRTVEFDTEGLTEWDSGLVTLIVKIVSHCSQNQIVVERNGLPQGVQRLLALSEAVPEKKEAQKKAESSSFLAQVGGQVISALQFGSDTLGFLGDSFLAFLKLIRGKARFQRSDLALIIQDCGPQALPIVTLVSFLVGLILAFMGAVQLKMFGAQIYVANLVALGMVREMGSMMTGIIMAGRTGAAFAAQLGTMQVNEEIDAFKTLGVSPMEFLVLPRMLALALMMPLLSIYADLMGILGGALVSVGIFDISIIEYINQTKHAVTLIDFLVGIVKASGYGILVAVAGCLQGINCGRSALDVGNAATSAVVMAIVYIIISDSAFNIITTIVGV